MRLLPDETARALVSATKLFQQMLVGPDGAPGRRYLDERGVTKELVHNYGLGYGVSGYRMILEGWGVPAEIQHKIGLLDDAGDETMGRRVTFPWLSMAGHFVTGIGGRAVDGRRPKYDNSPESAWFAKGRAVFGLHQSAAAIHGADWALVVEGPFDAIALARMGWTNAVATVGAKVTLDQLLLVARLTDRVVVMLDDDEGGRRGRQALEKLVQTNWLPPGLTVQTAVLRGAKDAGDPACTTEMVRDAVEQSLPLHR